MQRAEMLELAVRVKRGLSVDRRELRRDGPSYTFDTLGELRAEHGEAAPIARRSAPIRCSRIAWHAGANCSTAPIVMVQRPMNAARLRQHRRCWLSAGRRIRERWGGATPDPTPSCAAASASADWIGGSPAWRPNIVREGLYRDLGYMVRVPITRLDAGFALDHHRPRHQDQPAQPAAVGGIAPEDRACALDELKAKDVT